MTIDVPDVDTSATDTASFTDAFAKGFAEACADTFSLTNYDSNYVDNQMQVYLQSSISSGDADAATLQTMFQQAMESESVSQAMTLGISEMEPYMGTDDLSVYFVLYYSDGVVCAEGLFDGTGFIEGPYA